MTPPEAIQAAELTEREPPTGRVCFADPRPGNFPGRGAKPHAKTGQETETSPMTDIQAPHPNSPVPYTLTPEGEAAAAEPDTWTRREAGPSMIAVFREWAALDAEQEPEAGS